MLILLRAINLETYKSADLLNVTSTDNVLFGTRSEVKGVYTQIVEDLVSRRRTCRIIRTAHLSNVIVVYVNDYRSFKYTRG